MNQNIQGDFQICISVPLSNEFEGQLFFSHGNTNSCGAAIGFVGTKTLNVLNINRDNLGRILIIEKKLAIPSLCLLTFTKLIPSQKIQTFVIFGEFANLKENDLLLDNTILVLFKDDQIAFSYLILSKNLLKLQILQLFFLQIIFR